MAVAGSWDGEADGNADGLYDCRDGLKVRGAGDDGFLFSLYVALPLSLSLMHTRSRGHTHLLGGDGWIFVTRG